MFAAGCAKTWIVKIILGQFSHIRGTLLTRLQKLETWFLQRTRKSHTSVFASFLGVSILFAMLPLLDRIGFTAFDQQAANQPLIQDEAAQLVTKC